MRGLTPLLKTVGEGACLSQIYSKIDMTDNEYGDLTFVLKIGMDGAKSMQNI